jgi:hypothetical protein
MGMSILNPGSSEWHSLDHFDEIKSGWEKAGIGIATALTTFLTLPFLGIGGLVTFRALTEYTWSKQPPTAPSPAVPARSSTTPSTRTAAKSSATVAAAVGITPPNSTQLSSSGMAHMHDTVTNTQPDPQQKAEEKRADARMHELGVLELNTSTKTLELKARTQDLQKKHPGIFNALTKFQNALTNRCDPKNYNDLSAEDQFKVLEALNEDLDKFERCIEKLEKAPEVTITALGERLQNKPLTDDQEILAYNEFKDNFPIRNLRNIWLP